MYRTSYHSLQNYNATPRGTVQGPPVFPQIPKMNNETPLYPKINHGYNALVYDGTGSPYYRINSGPYGAFEKGNSISRFLYWFTQWFCGFVLQNIPRLYSSK